MLLTLPCVILTFFSSLFNFNAGKITVLGSTGSTDSTSLSLLAIYFVHLPLPNPEQQYFYLIFSHQQYQNTGCLQHQFH